MTGQSFYMMLDETKSLDFNYTSIGLRCIRNSPAPNTIKLGAFEFPGLVNMLLVHLLLTSAHYTDIFLMFIFGNLSYFADNVAADLSPLHCGLKCQSLTHENTGSLYLLLSFTEHKWEIHPTPNTKDKKQWVNCRLF